MPLTTSYIADRGFIGMAVESVIGTPVPATSWIQLLDESLALEPGVIAQKLIRQSRSNSFVPVLGEQQVAGKIETPLYVDQGLMLLAALIGTDTYQSSTAAGAAVGIGASGVATIGTSTIVSTVQTSTPLAPNDYVQIQQVTGTIGDTNLSEIHKVTAVSGAGPYTITIGSETLVRGYTTLSFISRIPSTTTVFSHTLHPDQPNASTYKTLTVEKNAAGLDSRQHAGVTVNKGDLKLDSKNIAKMSYELIGLTDTNVAPSTPVYGTSAPLALANFALSLFGSPDTSVKTFDLSIDQGAKPEWTFSGSNMPGLIQPMERKITGKWTNIVQSRTYYTNALTLITGSLSLTLTQAPFSIIINIPKMHIDKISDPQKVGALYYFDVSFDVDFDDASGRDIGVIVSTSTWLPII